MDTTVAHVLHNPFYIGRIVHKGEEYPGKQEAIVPFESWEKVQNIGKTIKVGKLKNRRQNMHIFLLQGLVKCSWCGSKMSPYYGYAKGIPYYYYDCSKRRHTNKEGCEMKSVPAIALEDVIAKRLTELSQNQDLTVQIAQRASESSSQLLDNLTQAKASLGRKQRQISQKIDALVESIADSKVGIKSISRKLIELEEHKEQLDEEILNLDLQIEETKKTMIRTKAKMSWRIAVPAL